MHDTVRAHGLGVRCVMIQPAIRQARLATQPGSATIRPGKGTTTRHNGRHDMEPSVSNARGLCAQDRSRCALGAPNPVLTQCTVLSHCLGHCS